MGSACCRSTTRSSSSPTTSCSRSRPRRSASVSDCYRSTTATAPSGKRSERPRWPTDLIAVSHAPALFRCRACAARSGGQRSEARCRVLAGEPHGRRGSESRDEVLLYLPVPGHDVLRGAVAPLQVDEMVWVAAHGLPIFRRRTDPERLSSNVRLPKRDVRQGVLDGPTIAGRTIER